MNDAKKVMPTLSDAQKTAVYGKGNIIVSAGAGCGKTFTMIKRIINKLVNEGAKLDEMLIVTFTRAAAADIRVKLAAELNELRSYGEKERVIAEEAINAMPVCDIGTLHSFCQHIVRTYFFAAGIEPSATIAEDKEARLIERACVRRAVENAYAAADPRFMAMYTALSSRRDDNAVVEAIETIVDYALSARDPDEYFDKSCSDEEIFPALDGYIEARRAPLLAEAEEVAAAIKSSGLGGAFIDAAHSLKDYVAGRIDDLPYTSYRPSKADGGSASAIKQLANDRYKAFKKKCKAFRDFCADAAASKTRHSGDYARALCDVARDALAEYDRRKRALGKIDYSDLEHGAKRALSDAGCKAEISSRIKYVFIDEFQDVSPLQAALTENLRDCGAEMFLVGDIKQSIYGFRRCDPRFFAEILKSDNGYTKVFLDENRRSDKKIIEFVNGVFDAIMTEESGGADYSEHRLKGVSEREGAAEYVVIERESAESVAEKKIYSVVSETPERTLNREAVYVADRILRLIDGTGGDIDLGSIAVLVRTTTGAFTADLVRLLRSSGVRVCLGKKTKLSDFPEAVALVDIARCVDNGLDDVAMYTALRSPMGMFSDGELAEIAAAGEDMARAKRIEPERSGSHGYTFCQKIKAYSGEYSARLNAFFELREKFSKYEKCHDAAEALGFITAETDYFGHVCEYYGSAQRSGAAIEALISVAAHRNCDLHTFIEYCDAADFELDIASGGDAVNITTIHSSKGLEYDYCFVSDIGRKFNYNDFKSNLIVSEDGVAVKCPIVEDGRKKLVEGAPLFYAKVIGIDRQKAEEMRLFYVALTRAKKQLVVTAMKYDRTPDDACAIGFMKNRAASLGTPQLPNIEKAKPPAPKNAALVEKAVKSICEFDYEKTHGGVNAPVKTCVTALVREDDDDYTNAAPILTKDDRGGSGETARLRGTAFHRAMELIDFDAPDFDRIAPRCDNIELVDREKILRAAKAMAKLAKGGRVYKERYFIADLQKGESVLVQGVIDLLIVYPDGAAAIVDYKTGRRENIMCGEYKEQLGYYAAAVERATPYKVTKMYLYSFDDGLMEVEGLGLRA